MSNGMQYTKKPVEIRILTDGSAEGTRIYIAGDELTRVLEFGITIKGRRQVSMQICRAIPGTKRSELLQYYGPSSFEKLGASLAEVSEADFIGAGIKREIQQEG